MERRHPAADPAAYQNDYSDRYFIIIVDASSL